jgi:GT2 family glycosyltransferase
MTSGSARPSVTAVVLAWGAEPLLEQCVDALLGSTGVDVEVVVVDNGGDPAAVEAVATRTGARVLRPGENTGYARGCRLGVEASDRPWVALVNSDAVVQPTALAALVTAVDRPGVGIATASVRLHSDLDTVNSVGNPVHFLMLSWAGAHGEPARHHRVPADVASASGAACAMSRRTWDALHGFADEYFAYHEDTELSLRCWQRGLRVVYAPDAVVAHDYAFSRNAFKMHLLERNRLATLLTLPERRTLLLLAPAALALEAGLLLLAVSQGWGREKLLGWVWLWRHRRWLRERRRQVQAERVVGDRDLVHLFASRFGGSAVALPPALEPADVLLGLWWQVVRRLVRARGLGPSPASSAGGSAP